MYKDYGPIHDRVWTIFARLRYTPAMNDLLVTAHAALIAADKAYAENPTPENHHRILQVQRTYYVTLRQQYRRELATAPSPKAVLAAVQWENRARIIRNRAQLNLKREKDNPQWQEIALYQYQRAQRTLMRAVVQAEFMLPDKPPAPPKPRKPKRVKHPITGRYVNADD